MKALYMLEAKENAINFFKSKKIEVKTSDIKIESNLIKINKTILQFIKRQFTYDNAKCLALAGSVLACIITFGWLFVRTAVNIAEEEKVKLQVEQIEKIALDKKVLAQKAFMYQKIEQLNQDDIEKTISFINSIEEQQINQLVNLYWSMVYLKENKRDINMKIVNSKIKKTINVVQSHYANRRYEVLTTYEFVKNKQRDSIGHTYDKQDSLVIVYNWIINQKLGKVEPLNVTKEITSDWMELINNPKELMKYLEANKDNIEKSKSFLID